MNPDIKTQWLSALRSGKYQQTRGALHRVTRGTKSQPVGFCCLGVLCDIAVQAGVVKEAAEAEGIVGYQPVDASSDQCVEKMVLPVHVWKWAGLVDSLGLTVQDAAGFMAEDLPSLNDSGKTFAEIADIIEEHA